MSWAISRRQKRKNRSRSDSAPLIGVVSCLSPEEERQDPYFSAIRKALRKNAFGKSFITSSIHLGSFQEHMFHELDGVIVIGSLQDEALTNISAAFRHAVFVNGTPIPPATIPSAWIFMPQRRRR